MKKLLKWLTFPLIAATTIPVVLTLTSCSFVQQKNLKSLTLNQLGDQNNHVRYNELKQSNQSFNDLLFGNTSFHKGNYITIVGSSVDKNLLTGLFLGENGHPFTNSTDNINSLFINNDKNSILDQWRAFNDDYFPSGLNLGIECFIESTLIENYKFAGNIGEQDHDENEINNGVISPFDKWDSNDQEINEDHKEGEYKRIDSNAKNYRELVSYISKLMGSGNISDTSTGFAIVWVEGYPKQFITSSEISSWSINSNFYSNILKHNFVDNNNNNGDNGDDNQN